MPRTPRVFKSIEFILFAVVFASYAYFYPGAGHNEAARFDSIRAVLDEHRLIVDTFSYNSADLIRVNDHYYSSKAPGLSMLGLPAFAVLDFVSRPLPITPELRYHLICYLTGVFTVGLLSALMCVLIFRYLKMSWAATEMQAVLVALSISLGTIVFPFSTIFFSHVVAASLGFLGFCLVEKISIQSRARALTSVLAAGFILGFNVCVEYPAAIITAFVGCYAAIRFYQIKRPQWIVLFGLSLILGLMFLPIYNKVSFGDPFFLSYEAYKSATNTTFKAQSVGLFGVRYDFLNLGFLKLFFANLVRITVLPLRGLFYLNPILLLVPAGFFYAFRSRARLDAQGVKADILLSLAIFVSFLGMNAAYGDSIVYWGGGASFGPRHVIPALPFLCVPLLFALRQIKTTFVFPVLAFISAFYCLMAASIEPRSPYSPDNLIFEFYLPRFANGLFSITHDGVFSDRPVVDGSVGFNIGKLMHLPGHLELIPLFIIWILAARAIEKRTASRSFLSAVILFCCGLAFLSAASLVKL
jgi:hypothetical protein